MSWPSNEELQAIVEGEGIEPGGTNIPLIQAMAKELLELRRLASYFKGEYHGT